MTGHLSRTIHGSDATPFGRRLYARLPTKRDGEENGETEREDNAGESASFQQGRPITSAPARSCCELSARALHSWMQVKLFAKDTCKNKTKRNLLNEACTRSLAVSQRPDRVLKNEAKKKNSFSPCSFTATAITFESGERGLREKKGGGNKMKALGVNEIMERRIVTLT